MAVLFAADPIPKGEDAEWNLPSDDEDEEEDNIFFETASDSVDGTRSYIITTLGDKYSYLVSALDLKSGALRKMFSE